MPRDFNLYLNDIKAACEKIIRYTANLTQEQFIKDEILYDAILRNLMIIGEAAKNLPDDTKKQYSNVEWKKICGLRDILAHVYFGIDNYILWDVVSIKIPALLQNLTIPQT